MNTLTSKVVLATRGRGSKEASIFVGCGADTSDIKLGLSEWLLNNFEITNVYRDEVINNSGDVVAAYFIDSNQGAEDVCIYTRSSGCERNPMSADAGTRCHLKDMADDDLVYLVYGLTLSGYIEYSSDNSNQSNLAGEKLPMILLAWLEPSLREQGSLSIKRFATNDPILIRVSKKDGDNKALFACQQKQINFSGKYPYDLGLMKDLDNSVVNNSLLLSNEFMDIFSDIAMKRFEFGCKRSMRIKEHSNIEHRGDLRVYSTSSLLQENGACGSFYWRALNNYLFGNNHEVTLPTKKEKADGDASNLVISIDDNNQARQTLSISLHRHHDGLLPGDSEWFTLCTSTETTERKFLAQSYHIHTCCDIAELIDEMADILKGHNNLYKNGAALNSLISGAFNDCGLLAA